MSTDRPSLRTAAQAVRLGFASLVLLIAREELAMSMVLSPTPAQKFFRPADEPPDSTIGVLNFGLALPNCSATTLAKGSTVEDPAIWIWSRAWAPPAMARASRVPTAT